MPVDLERARQVKSRHEAELMRRPNVISVGVGLRQRAGKPTDEAAIIVTVRKKLPPSQIRPGEAFPAELEGVPVDVQESGEVTAH
jgi:hypothetical protein